MPKKHVAAICFALNPLTGGELPAAFTFIPAPGTDGFVRGVDGRAWRMSRPDQVAASLTRKRSITENHAGRLAAPKGLPSPSFGWMRPGAAKADGGGVVVDVDWTPRGKTALLGEDYGFFSPEFEFDPDTKEITAIVGGSLTNDPNFPQLALNSEQDHPELPPMSLKAIALALGLAESADESACLTAINSIKAERQTALNAASHPDPQLFVPMATHQVALNGKSTAEGELKTFKAAQLENDVVAAVDGALAAGKIVPATRDFYLGMCRADGGLEKFNKFVELQPVIAEPTQTGKKPGADVTGDEGLTPAQLAICSASGITPKAYAETLKGLKA